MARRLNIRVEIEVLIERESGVVLVEEVVGIERPKVRIGRRCSGSLPWGRRLHDFRCFAFSLPKHNRFYRFFFLSISMGKRKRDFVNFAR